MRTLHRCVKAVARLASLTLCAPLVALAPSAASAAPLDWRCLCYQERTPDGAREATACRATAGECAALEARALKGSKSIVPGSLLLPCVPVSGAHPSEPLGGVGWLPSKRPGAVWTPSGCYLGSYLGAAPKGAAHKGAAPRAPQERVAPTLPAWRPVALALPAGWALAVTSSPRLGAGWLRVTKAGAKETLLKQLPSTGAPLRAEGVAEARCDEVALEVTLKHQDAQRALLWASFTCSGEGADIGETRVAHALLSLRLSGAPEAQTLWAGEALSERNDSLGTARVESFELSVEKGELRVSSKVEECAEEGCQPPKRSSVYSLRL